MHTKHLWKGEWISDETLEKNLSRFLEFTSITLSQKFPLEYFIEILSKLQKELLKKESLYEKFLHQAMQTDGATKQKAEGMLGSIISFISKENIQKKLTQELGSKNPFTLERPHMKEEYFESWMPLGTLVHIAPTNVFSVGVLAVIEGLLSANINILKTSANQHQLPQLFFEALLDFDRKNLLKEYIIILEVSSKEKALLQKIINKADVVSAWGSEEAIRSIEKMVPKGVRLVEWGHKISFAYFAKECLEDREAMRKVCEDISLLDQNACSSPQDIFIESNSFEELQKFAKNFAKILEEVSQLSPRMEPNSAQQAEITTLLSIAKTEEAMQLTSVIQAEDLSWSVIADRRRTLSVSPLFRTILIKPLPQNEIISNLHPMKSYLQTVALIAPKRRVFPLSQLLFSAGALRIRGAGEMHNGYVGEPHDGLYALPSFMKRVSLVLDGELDGIANFASFQEPYKQELSNIAIMNKSTFQAMEVDEKFRDLTFKSGGSSGKPTFSYFSYEDYHTHMKAAAVGLLSAGVEPNKDSVINMFAAGHLYGGFLSFFTIFEYLKIPQYPMGVVDDLEEVGRLIVNKKINTLVTVPALIMKLFEENELLFREHQPIKKLFFAGDHFAKSQIEYLKKEFRVKLIRAAAYGSNDAGVLGYQCPECKINEYHLLSELQTLEVFDFQEEKVLKDGEMGRLIFSSKHRKGQNILRYDLGDTGFIHKQKCNCGRVEPKFTLLGRSSDSFKAGGPFLNYTKFKHYLEDFFAYADLVQILLSNRGTTQLLTLKLLKSITYDAQEIEEILVRNYEELEISTKQLGVEFQVALVDAEEFEIVEHSGKLRHIIDKRSES